MSPDQHSTFGLSDDELRRRALNASNPRKVRYHCLKELERRADVDGYQRAIAHVKAKRQTEWLLRHIPS